MKCAHCGRLSSKAPCRASPRCMAWQRVRAKLEAFVFESKEFGKFVVDLFS